MTPLLSSYQHVTHTVRIKKYSTWGHVLTLAKAEAAGVTKAGGKASLFQIPETLPSSVLEKMYAPPKDASIPTLDDPSTLLDYDGFLLGIPTRYGNFPAQWKAFWDGTGQIWREGGFHGKFAGLFVSSGTQGGGQESTNLAAMSTLAGHGMIYVPLGNKPVMPLIAEMAEVRGGSAWGAGTFAVSHRSHLTSSHVFHYEGRKLNDP